MYKNVDNVLKIQKRIFKKIESIKKSTMKQTHNNKYEKLVRNSKEKDIEVQSVVNPLYNSGVSRLITVK